MRSYHVCVCVLILWVYTKTMCVYVNNVDLLLSGQPRAYRHSVFKKKSAEIIIKLYT